jgi:hypothetical protein
MNWTFIVVRNNSVEQARTFSDFWEGCKHTDSFIKSIDPNFHGNFPIYNRNENYRKDDLTVGLYKSSYD